MKSLLPILLFSAHAALAGGNMILTSSAFENGGQIPVKYTCDGQDISPPLAWSGIPPETKSLVLFVDDPDAPDPANPKMDWTHWLLYNIPPGISSLPEGIRPLPRGTLSGWTDFRKTAYGGPCPPIGTHRYFHRLYALDIVLPDLGKASMRDIERAMEGHVLGQAQLIGKYRR
jgi:Raf kinase inhibitor-like YbhB/YbcL family protein